MLEEQAVVVKVVPGLVLVETCRQSACQSCSAKNSCGHSLLSKISKGRAQQVSVQTYLPLAVGDQVMLGLDERAFLRGSALIYMLPLVTLMIAALVGEFLFGKDTLASLLLSAFGLLVGFVCVYRYSQRHSRDAQYQPVILRRFSPVRDISLSNA